jgi:phosphatidylethanolamine-binding protein (PEBP) family uncharacterized protein
MIESAIMGNGAPVDSDELNKQLEQNDESLNVADMTMQSRAMMQPSMELMNAGSTVMAGAYPGSYPVNMGGGAPVHAFPTSLRGGPKPLGVPAATKWDAGSGSLMAEQSRLSQTAGSGQAVAQPPAEFWAWKTTPAPKPPPGPNPQVMWVAQTTPPLPTTPPVWDNCYACDCLFVYDTDIVQGGSIPDKYSCFGGKPTVHVPQFKWAGVPKNTGLDHPIRHADGSECTKSQSFAVTMADLDYPNGVGELGNTVRNMFWAANIPGDWTELTEAGAYSKYKGVPTVVVGRNDAGDLGMEVPCPKHGIHRVKFTLWALRSYLGTEQNPLDPNTPVSAMMPLFEEKELSRFVFFGTIAAQGYTAYSFLQEAQQVKDWFR